MSAPETDLSLGVEVRLLGRCLVSVSPLALAIASNSPPAVEALLASGADPERCLRVWHSWGGCALMWGGEGGSGRSGLLNEAARVFVAKAPRREGEGGRRRGRGGAASGGGGGAGKGGGNRAAAGGGSGEGAEPAGEEVQCAA